jgi:predicted NBD/HSP70 family sugar kinase
MGGGPHTRTTARDIRRRNRSLLLSTLFFQAPLSRLELGRITGLSSATVSNVTAELVEEHLIAEVGQVESDGGRPRTLLRVDPAYGNVIGVDVGETGVRVELFDLAMSRLATVTRALPTSDPVGRPDAAAVADRVAAGIREVMAGSGVDPASVIGAGIGVPGTVDQGRLDQGRLDQGTTDQGTADQGSAGRATVTRGPAGHGRAHHGGAAQRSTATGPLIHAPTIGWDGVAMVDLLRARGVTTPLFLDNGAKTLGQAEMWFGAGRGAQHVVIALVGSGVGAAVVTDGATYRGASSSAGEWGHTTVVYQGRPCRCGSRGCLEAYVGAEGILDRYRKARRGDRSALPTDEVAGIEALLAAADRSKVAAGLLDETVGYLGAGIASLINLFNPERVILGGWAGLALGGRYLPRIRDAAKAHALAHPYGQATIELCQLGPDAVAFGAATLPIAALLAHGQPARGTSPIKEK